MLLLGESLAVGSPRENVRVSSFVVVAASLSGKRTLARQNTLLIRPSVARSNTGRTTGFGAAGAVPQRP
jgi:hypothetical protein